MGGSAGASPSRDAGGSAGASPSRDAGGSAGASPSRDAGGSASFREFSAPRERGDLFANRRTIRQTVGHGLDRPDGLGNGGLDIDRPELVGNGLANVGRRVGSRLRVLQGLGGVLGPPRGLVARLFGVGHVERGAGAAATRRSSSARTMTDGRSPMADVRSPMADG